MRQRRFLILWTLAVSATEISSNGIFPGIRYTSRMRADALNTLPGGEQVCQNGGTTRVWIFLGDGAGGFSPTPVVEWRGNNQRDQRRC